MIKLDQTHSKISRTRKSLKQSNPEYSNISKAVRSRSGMKIRPIGVIKNTVNIGSKDSKWKINSVIRTHENHTWIAPSKKQEI